MKKYNLIYALCLLFFWSCDEPSNTDILNSYTEINSDAKVSVITSDGLWVEPLAASYEAVFEVTGSDVESISGLSVGVAINVDGVVSDVAEIETIDASVLPDTVELTYTAGDFLSALGMESADVKAGDKFQVIFTKTVDGKVVKDRTSFGVLVACPTNIPLGTWTLKGGGGTSVLSYDGAGVYSLSELQFGYYNPAYGDIPAKFLDVCDDLTLLGSTVGTAYGIAWTGTGSYDADAGEMTFAYYDATYCGPSAGCQASVTLVAP